MDLIPVRCLRQREQRCHVGGRGFNQGSGWGGTGRRGRVEEEALIATVAGLEVGGLTQAFPAASHPIGNPVDHRGQRHTR